LWHELTESLLELFEKENVRSSPAIITLYREFISGFADRISQTKFVKLAIIASEACSSAEESRLFLEEVSAYLND
jgi:hypothetical protein